MLIKPPDWLRRPSPVVVACSGPSLCMDRLWDTTYDICAVSTAIRSLYRARIPVEYWAVMDPINPDHGVEGVRAAEDGDIIKIISSHDQPYRCGMADSRRTFDGGNVFLPLSHHVVVWPFTKQDVPAGWLSISLAIAYLVAQGYRTLLFAGCDLKDINKWHHGNRKEPFDTSVALDDAFAVIKWWMDWINENNLNIEFRSWTPDSRINELMPFEQDTRL